MAGRKRRRFDARTKARAALEAIREQKTSAQIASEHSCHSTQITKWKRQALEGLPGIFEQQTGSSTDDKEIAMLYEQIGRLKVELDWVKKKSGGLT
jgi:putative transposase